MAYLEVVQGKEAGTKYPVTLKDKLTFGRDPEEATVLNDDRASRKHFMVYSQAGAYAVRDLNSKNGTFVNEKKLSIQTLRHGDKIRVGQTILVFNLDATELALENSKSKYSTDAVSKRQADNRAATVSKVAKQAAGRSRNQLIIGSISFLVLCGGLWFVYKKFIKQPEVTVATTQPEPVVVEKTKTAPVNAAAADDAKFAALLDKTEAALQEARYQEVTDNLAQLSTLSVPKKLVDRLNPLLDATDALGMLREHYAPFKEPYITFKHTVDNSEKEGIQLSKEGGFVTLLDKDGAVTKYAEANVQGLKELSAEEREKRLEEQFKDCQKNFAVASPYGRYVRAAEFYQRGYDKPTGKLLHDAAQSCIKVSLTRQVAAAEIARAGLKLNGYAINLDPARAATETLKEAKLVYYDAKAYLPKIKEPKENYEYDNRLFQVWVKVNTALGNKVISEKRPEPPKDIDTGTGKTEAPGKTETPGGDDGKTIIIVETVPEPVSMANLSPRVKDALALMAEARKLVGAAGAPSSPNYNKITKQAVQKFEAARTILEKEIGNTNDSYLDSKITEIESELFWIHKTTVE